MALLKKDAFGASFQQTIMWINEKYS